MKKRITAIILAVLMILSTFGTIIASAADEVANKVVVNTKLTDERHKAEKEAVAGMTAVPSSPGAKFKLYIDELYLTVAIENVATGEIMLSNPVTGGDEYKSQLSVMFRPLAYLNTTTYYTFKDCVSYDNPQHVLTIGTDSLTVEYTLGKINQTPVLPTGIGYNEMQALITRLRESGLYTDAEIESKFKSKYDYYSVTLTEPNANGERLPIANPDENVAVKYEAYGIRDEAIYILRISNLNQKKTAEAMLKAVGYTEEDKEADYAKIYYKEADATDPIIVVPLTYKVTDTGFTAEVDASKVVYDEENYVVEGLGILPYLNAATSSSKTDEATKTTVNETETGYTFVPDGSGALVRFEDVVRQGAANDITFKLYGLDNAYTSLKPNNEEQMILPVFGMVINELPYNSGFFGIIESGDAVASITSSHRAYHSIYPSFTLSAAERAKMSNASTGVEGSLDLRGEMKFKDMCSVRYIMLTPDELQSTYHGYDLSYMGMAECYRDYLESKGVLEKFESSDVDKKTKLFIEVLGSMKVEEKVLTFPVTVNKALTTFDHIKAMRKELADAGVGPMNFILTGFANEGLSTKYPTKIKWLRSVGGKKGFNELLADAEANGYEVSPNFDFTYSTFIFGKDNIKYRTYGAKGLDKKFAMKLTYDPAYQMLSYVGGIVISAGSYDYAYEKFAAQAVKYDMENLAVGTLGSDLNSDFNEENFMYRTESAKLTQELLGKLTGENGSATDYKLLAREGNAYALKYLDYVIDMGLDSSRRTNESEAVPFVGIVLHGSKTFTGEALNMDGDSDYALLKALENGSNLYFTLAYENVENLKLNWRFAQYYSVSYDLWKDDMIEMYKEYNELMASKQIYYITDHEFLNTSEGGSRYSVTRNDDSAGALENSRVVRVEYENGEGFFLNYNADFSVKVVYEGTTYVVPALGYAEYTSK